MFFETPDLFERKTVFKEYYNFFGNVISWKLGRKGILWLLSVWVSLDLLFGTFFG